ncbi:MAG: ATP-binding protein [Bacteroidota bacterium]
MNKHYQKYLNGGGEMGELTRNFDWSSTSLGTPEQWPASLLTAISIVLNSKFPMFIWWGPELIQFYNDAYRPSLGMDGKHPMALGQPGADTWQEIWSVIKPMIDQVLSGGESTWSEDQLIPIYRNNQLEEVYWTFSYSKLLDEEGEIAGVLVTCTETTNQVISMADIQKTKTELEFAINAAELGTWDLDPGTNTFMGNQRLKKWFGLPPESKIDLSLATNVIAENDRRKVLEAITQAMNYETGGNYDIEYTIISPADPAPRLVRALGKAIFNENKQAVRFSGIMQDITQERETLGRLKAAHHQLELALDQSVLSKIAAQLGTFDLDLIRGTMEWDQRCRVLFGISHDRPLDYEKDFVAGLHPEDRNRIISIIGEVFDKAKTNGEYDVEYRTIGAEDGQIRWVRAKGKAYFDNNETATRFIGSVLDITEQKTDEIRKNDFIGMVSHELKTPLTSLKGYIQFLGQLARKKEDETSLNLLKRADTQISKMGTMINGFLDVSRLEAGKINLECHPVDLRLLIQETIEDAGVVTHTQRISLVPGENIQVSVDREKIGSVISNLLSNALKYSTPETNIEISCEREGQFTRVSIKDEGPGIKLSDQERLFERFYRVESNDNKVISGFGIGLYLCAEIIERHGGKIGVTSEIDQGSIFYFLLPLA